MKQRVLALWMIWALFGSVSANNSLIATSYIGEMIEGADLVFQGRVSQIAYKVFPQPKGGDLPMTFVTFEVKEIFKGKYSQKNLTLRFLGGPVGTKLMTAGDAPLFNKGQDEILFVTENKKVTSPVVTRGRLRIFQGRVYDSEGFGILKFVDGRFITSTQIPPLELRKFHINSLTVTKEFSKGQDRGPEKADFLPLEEFAKGLRKISSLYEYASKEDSFVSYDPQVHQTIIFDPAPPPPPTL